jgi:hypothetical protein
MRLNEQAAFRLVNSRTQPQLMCLPHAERRGAWNLRDRRSRAGYPLKKGRECDDISKKIALLGTAAIFALGL